MKKRALLVLFFMTIVAQSAFSSSHREAPEVTKRPQIDGTDFYMFRSYEPGRENYITLIANYNPLQDPYGGPNYFPLDVEAVYDIHVSNDGDAKEDITFRFRFDQHFKGIEIGVGDGSSQMQVAIPLVNAGVFGVDNDDALNIQRKYQVQYIEGDSGRGLHYKVRRTSQLLTNSYDGEKVFAMPFDNIGKKSVPDYDAYAEKHIYDVDIPNCGVPGRVFVGQRKESFAVNLGEIFDLVNVTDPLGAMDAETSSTKYKNITSLALEIPTACLTGGSGDMITAWTTASKPKIRTFRTLSRDMGMDHELGPLVQVSRLGNPLVNEVVIGLPDKDKYNASHPVEDDQFSKYITNPTLPEFLEILFGDMGVQAPNFFPRSDLIQIFLTGVSGLNQDGSYGEMMRLNTNIAPVAKSQQNSLGVLAGDNAGYPNGRRPGDDVVDISLRAIMGVLLDPLVAPSSQLPFTDGVAQSAEMFDNEFPYLTTPIPGSPNEMDQDVDEEVMEEEVVVPPPANEEVVEEGDAPEGEAPADEEVIEEGDSQEGEMPADEEVVEEGEAPADEEVVEEGDSPEGEMPADEEVIEEGDSPEGEMPADEEVIEEGDSQEGEMPADEEVIEEGDSQEGEMPADEEVIEEGDSQEGEAPADEEVVEEGDSSEGEAPADEEVVEEGDSQEGEMPADEEVIEEGDSPEGEMPADEEVIEEGDSPEGEMPADEEAVEEGDSSEGEMPADEEVMEEGDSSEGDAPADEEVVEEGDSAEGDAPADEEVVEEGDSAEGEAPADEEVIEEGDSQEGEMPADEEVVEEGDSSEGEAPADEEVVEEGGSAEGDAPADEEVVEEGDSAEGEAPADEEVIEEGDAPEGEMPADEEVIEEGDAPEGEMPTDEEVIEEGDSQEGEIPADEEVIEEGDSSEGEVPADEEVIEEGDSQEGEMPADEEVVEEGDSSEGEAPADEEVVEDGDLQEGGVPANEEVSEEQGIAPRDEVGLPEVDEPLDTGAPKDDSVVEIPDEELLFDEEQEELPMENEEADGSTLVPGEVQVEVPEEALPIEGLPMEDDVQDEGSLEEIIEDENSSDEDDLEEELPLDTGTPQVDQGEEILENEQGSSEQTSPATSEDGVSEGAEQEGSEENNESILVPDESELPPDLEQDLPANSALDTGSPGEEEPKDVGSPSSILVGDAPFSI